MKRQEIVSKLIEKGLSESTLVKFTDKQLLQLSDRMLNESTVMISKKSPTFKTDVDTAKKENKTIETYEQERDKSDKKKNKTKNKEIKEDGWDSKSVSKQFKKINTSTKRYSPKSNDNPFLDDNDNDKKSYRGKDDFYKKLETSKFNPKTKELEVGESVSKKSKKEVKEWVNSIAENNYHPFTSKNEIMELIKTKLNEVSYGIEHGPNVKKGHNKIPEFMSYESIKSVESSSPKPSPSTNPGPGIAPSPVKTPSKPDIKPKPGNPFSPKPGEKSKPKALKEKSDEVK